MTRKLDWNVYIDTAAKTVAEGIVMLKNEHHALPLSKEKEIAVFGTPFSFTIIKVVPVQAVWSMYRK